MISFLRALVNNPKIWILDEATAFFDQEAESECFKVFERLRSTDHKNFTLIQVAHRKGVLNRMDRIIELSRPSLPIF